MVRRLQNELYSLTPCFVITMAKQTMTVIWRNHWQKLFVGILLLGFCFWSVRYLPSSNTDGHSVHPLERQPRILNVFHPNRHRNFPDEKLHPAFSKKLFTLSNNRLQEILQVNKCPACFGKKICEEFNQGSVAFENASTGLESKGVRFGRLYDQPVVIKSLSTKELFDKFDELICSEAEHTVNCDVSQALHDSSVVKDDSLLIKNLRQSPIVQGHLRPVSHSLLLCATDKLIGEFKDIYDENQNGKLEKSERGYLYTSLVLNPEPVLLQFFKKSEVKWPFPVYKGSCGRAAVMEHGGIPLHQYLSHHWLTRASIAIEIIDIIDRFENSDPEYVIFYGDLTMGNFAVQLNGRVLIIDLEDMALLDRSTLPAAGSEHSAKKKKVPTATLR